MAKNSNGCLFRRFFFVTFFWRRKESKREKEKQFNILTHPRPSRAGNYFFKSFSENSVPVGRLPAGRQG
jgi:hypothetical protein